MKNKNWLMPMGVLHFFLNNKKIMKKTIIILLSLTIIFSSFISPKVLIDKIEGDLFSKIFEIAKNWYEVEKLYEDNYEEMGSWLPDVGVRSKYYYLKTDLSINTLKTITGEAVFVSGPHKKEMEFFSETEFGHYNPKFIKIVSKVFTKLSKNKEFISISQEIYDNDFKNLIRIYYLAYKHLKENKTQRKEITTKYLSLIETQEDSPSYYLQEVFRDFAENHEEAGYDVYEGFTAPGFWIRRGIDNTDKDFYKLLVKVLKTYDKDFLKNN